MARPRVALLGGSFDPIHLGHLRSAEEVREALGLARVTFVPTGDPPHKPDRLLAPAEHRLAMVKLAIAGNPRFAASAVEIERGGVSYFVDTLEMLVGADPDAEWFFIVGMDAFRDMHTWRNLPRTFELASLVVTSRPPHPAEPSIEHLPVAAREAFCYDPATLSFRHRTGTSLRFLRITGLDISATAVREHARRGLSNRYLLPSAVEQYLCQNQLYRDGDTIV